MGLRNNLPRGWIGSQVREHNRTTSINLSVILAAASNHSPGDLCSSATPTTRSSCCLHPITHPYTSRGSVPTVTKASHHDKVSMQEHKSGLGFEMTNKEEKG
jgi:hypothetical protein